MENEIKDPWVKFENIKTQIVTTLIGLILLGAVLFDLLSTWDIPSVDAIPRGYFLSLLALVGFGHLFAKDTLIEKAKDLIKGFGSKDKEQK